MVAREGGAGEVCLRVERRQAKTGCGGRIQG